MTRIPIRDWDYDNPGLEVIRDGRHSLSIRQFDGWSDMTLSISDAAHARRLAAVLEAYASKETGMSALAEMKSVQLRARLYNEAAAMEDMQ